MPWSRARATSSERRGHADATARVTAVTSSSRTARRTTTPSGGGGPERRRHGERPELPLVEVATGRGQVHEGAVGIDTGPQREGQQPTELDAFRATPGRPRLGRGEEIAAQAGAPPIGVDDHQAQRCDQRAIGVTAHADGDRTGAVGRSEHDTGLVVAGGQQLVGGEVLVGRGRGHQRRQLLDPLGSPLLHRSPPRPSRAGRAADGRTLPGGAAGPGPRRARLRRCSEAGRRDGGGPWRWLSPCSASRCWPRPASPRPTPNRRSPA